MLGGIGVHDVLMDELRIAMRERVEAKFVVYGSVWAVGTHDAIS